jgi:hypothetical protein
MTYVKDYELVMKRRRAGLYGGSFQDRLETKAAKILQKAGVRPPDSQLVSGRGGKKFVAWKWLVDRAYKLEKNRK